MQIVTFWITTFDQILDHTLISLVPILMKNQWLVKLSVMNEITLAQNKTTFSNYLEVRYDSYSILTHVTIEMGVGEVNLLRSC